MKAKTNKHEEYIKAHAAAIPQLEAAIQQLKVARLDGTPFFRTQLL